MIMNIKAIKSKVNNERNIPGRFPARLIFVRNFSDYLTLVDELTTVCDHVFNLADYTKDDILPNLKELKKEIAKHNGQQLLLLSFGEYLRICIGRELDRVTAHFSEIWEQQQSENSTTKYIIPVFSAQDLFNNILPRLDERQKDFIWEVNESTLTEYEYNLDIYSPEFADVINADATNLHEWLQNWTSLFKDNNRHKFSIVTKLYHYAKIISGEVSVNIINQPFDYVVTRVADGEKLKDWGKLTETIQDHDFWKYIATSLKADQPFLETIKSLLNIRDSLDIRGVLARFSRLSDHEKNLLKILYQLYPSDDYCTFAINQAPTAESIPYYLRDSIFQLSEPSPSFIKQRTDALKELHPDYNALYNDQYFTKLDNIPAPQLRLMMLTYKTHAERVYAVKTVCDLLRNTVDANLIIDVNPIVDLLNADYPDLAQYLRPCNDNEKEINQYFNWYRRSKLINRPNTDAPCSIDFDSISTRNKVMENFKSIDSRNKDRDLTKSSASRSFWVDGLGVEWMPILLRGLNELSIGVEVKSKIAKAILPTETEYNHQWTEQDEKWDRLDKLSHNGMPDDKDYFSCIANQLAIMREIVQHVGEMLEKINRVIITGDHGSSRLAALLFHDPTNFAIDPPQNAIVHAHGRYVELKDNSYIPLTNSMERTELKGKHYVIMKNYQHFKQSGNAAGGNTDKKAVVGEVHGGMTPEEYLVPVIMVSRTKLLPTQEVPLKSRGITDDSMGLA
jgi:hypothetical protein